MTSQPAYPGYATPVFKYGNDDGIKWMVAAHPGSYIGSVVESGTVGWEAFDLQGRYVGLFPDKQAAGEALVKHAGYELMPPPEMISRGSSPTTRR